jgi:hypothetical protein
MQQPILPQPAEQKKQQLTVSGPFFIALYLFGLVICVPASFLVWFIRRRIFSETQVAGE